MKLITSYRDLLNEIDIYNTRLENLERELYGVERIKHTHKIDLDRYVDRHTKIVNEMASISAIIEDKERSKKEILDKINKLEGLEYKIAYKRFIEGKTHNEIAKEVGYTEQYIRKIFCKRVNKESTHIQKTM